jgi:rRNA maturation endonuclease Nob1
MNPIQRIRRLLGGGDDEPPYRCVHCGTGFERDYHDCPTCGNPYVKPTDESE